MKVGDKVAVIHQSRVVGISHIARETKLCWVIGSSSGNKYKKSDLFVTKGVLRIELATKEHIDELRKTKISHRLFETNWSNFDLETLEKVFAAVCGMTDTKENKK